jgi:hypothetical protein
MESMKSSSEISPESMHSLAVVLIRSLTEANLIEVVGGRQRVIGRQL